PRGNHYLFVLVDMHSRFVVLRAIATKQMSTIAQTLFDVFTLLGFPRIVQSDNGSEFVNTAIKQLFDGANIDHRLTLPFHPRSNGLVERSVQTAVSTIKKFLDGAQNDWDAVVPFAQFAMNTKVATIHNSTPYSVLFGRHANLLEDFSATGVAAP